MVVLPQPAGPVMIQMCCCMDAGCRPKPYETWDEVDNGDDDSEGETVDEEEEGDEYLSEEVSRAGGIA